MKSIKEGKDARTACEDLRRQVSRETGNEQKEERHPDYQFDFSVEGEFRALKLWLGDLRILATLRL